MKISQGRSVMVRHLVRRVVGVKCGICGYGVIPSLRDRGRTDAGGSTGGGQGRID